MSLTEIANALLESQILVNQAANQKLLEKEYLKTLKECNEANEIRDVLYIDRNMRLPVDLTIETFQRLITLDRSATNLRDFAAYLYFHGPDWDDIADELNKEADNL